jgi:hypothetical protein
MPEVAEATLREVMNYFSYTSMTEFRKDWNALSDEEKKEFKEGVAKAIASIQ